jgi:hypothetical protein
MKLPILTVLITLSFSLSAQITPNSQWTWIKGDSTTNQIAVYGSKGIANSANQPGARFGSATWRDPNGKFWLFGGRKSGSNFLNDLWMYDPTSNLWEWVSGDSTINNLGIYGTRGVPSATNKPGGKIYAYSWVANNYLWLFGGSGQGGVNGGYEDLWKYDLSTNQWTWMKGNNLTDQTGIYGTEGTPNALNNPSGRDGGISWVDTNNNLWLFGGFGYATIPNNFNGSLNDLWEYNISTNQWTWMSGDSSANVTGVYGTKGIANASNKPGGRLNGGYWNDNAGNFWLLGGYDISNNRELNDLWKYNIATNQWTWVNGDNIPDQFSVYGTKGVQAPTNKPGGRDSQVSWQDQNGDFWMFGGYGNTETSGDILNDVWKYNVASNQWTWVKGGNSGGEFGVYNSLGIPDNTSEPGARYVGFGWTDLNYNFWLMGGIGNSRSTAFGKLNDLWKLSPAIGNYTWIGATSTDWSVDSNWSGGVVPGVNDNVTIPGGTTYSAMIPNGVTVSIRTLTITTGAQVFLGTNAHLNVMH